MKPINTKTAMAAYLKLFDAERGYYGADKDLANTRRINAIQATREFLQNEKSYQAIQDAIVNTEKRATVRRISAEILLYTLADIDRRLGLPKKAKEGIVVWVDYNAQSFPRAYKWTPESTQVKAEFKGGSWRITGIYRAPCRRVRVEIEHTEANKAALIKRFTIF